VGLATLLGALAIAHGRAVFAHQKALGNPILFKSLLFQMGIAGGVGTAAAVVLDAVLFKKRISNCLETPSSLEY
jgi:hypothetical protein